VYKVVGTLMIVINICWWWNCTH